MTAPSWGALAEDKLSRLDGVEVETEADQVVVSIQGTLAPNFTSFTMQDPFRVVVDWAGSRLPEEGTKKTYDRGLVREVDTKQFNSEAEKISRVIVKLSQSTTYRVQAKGTTVRLVLDAVPDPLPAPTPEPVVAAVVDAAPEASNPLLVQEGPLTEPDVAIPTEVPVPKPAPVVIAKAPAPAPAPAVAPPAPSAPADAPPAPTPTPTPEVTPPAPKAVVAERASVPVVDEPPSVPDVDAPVPVLIAEAEPAAAPPVEPAAAPAEPEVMPEPVVAAAPAPAPVPVEPEPVVAAAPAPAPVVAAAPEPQPTVKAEPVRLATFTPPESKADTPEPAAKVSTPKFATAKKPEAKTQRLAAAMPKTKSSSDWSPPAVHYERRRSLKVVKIADPQDTLQPEGSTPADDLEVRETRPAPTMPTSPDANDFDPGPRVMKYIGFRQMAGTSRIFVRMDGKARYRQSQEGDLLVIELMNTSVPVKNNTRALDTSYFNSPVLRVQAVPRGENTRVEVRLREQGSFQVKRIGTTIAIDFSRAP